MKRNATPLNTVLIERGGNDDRANAQVGSCLETPLRSDAFERDDDLKVELIARHFQEIMHILGLDLSDDSLRDTPRRVAKMYVKEIFSGLDPNNAPDIKLFDNRYRYNQMLIEKDIPIISTCEHHFVPIVGKAHAAYISSGKVVGLSKINRIVEFYARRPQVQERMTMQIANHLKTALDTNDVALVIEAEHMCVSMRGVEHAGAMTITSDYSGSFRSNAFREQFLAMLG